MQRRTFARLVGGIATLGTVGPVGTTSGASSDVTVHDPVTVESWDRTELATTLYVPGSDGPHPVILMTHGWGFTRENPNYVSIARGWAELGYLTMVYDSRGFGDSGGQSTTNGPKEVADALFLLDRFAGGTFRLSSGETVDVDATPSANGPACGMMGFSQGGGIALLTAAATPSYFRDADALDLETLEAATPNLSLDSSPLDAITPYITWEDLLQALAPNDVIKVHWSSLLLGTGTEGYTRNEQPDAEGQDPRLYEFAAKAAATNELPDEAEAYLEKRSPDPAAIAANGVPTLLVQGWPDNLFPSNHAIRLHDGIRSADDDVEVALAFSPSYTGGHNEQLPTEQPPPVDVVQYLSDLTVAWMERFLAGDASLWNANGYPSVSLYQQQYPDVPDARKDDSRPAWRAAGQFPPEGATDATLDLAVARSTDRTVLGNSAAPTSVRGPAGTLFSTPSADAPVTAAHFDFAAADLVDVVGTPHLSLSVTPLGDEPIVFAKLQLADGPTDDGTVIDEQVMPYRIRDVPGKRTRIDFDLVAFQRYVRAGRRLRLTLSTTDNGYTFSRGSAGLVVHHAAQGESALTVPTTSDAETPLEGVPPLDQELT